MWPELETLLQDGIVGFFTQFELIEILAYPPNSRTPINLFTLAIAGDDGLSALETGFLTKRIALKSLKGWSFGLHRQMLSIPKLLESLNVLKSEGTWLPASMPIGMGKLTPLQRQFVPANSLNDVPYNRVLKNNFGNGSLVFELIDPLKTDLAPLLSKSTSLLDLSEKISTAVPLHIGKLADRLGGISIQLPVEIIQSRFGRRGGNYAVEVAWHPKATPRDLSATVEVVYDETISGFGSVKFTDGDAIITPDAGIGTFRGHIWDPQNSILLSATDETAFINTISFGMGLMRHEPRVFQSNAYDSNLQDMRIQLVGHDTQSIVGDTSASDIRRPVRNRIYKEERTRLTEQRRFVQYNPKQHGAATERSRALGDVRSLIDQFGFKGVWLWDPFLAPQDVIDTLFYNKNFGSEMRALTALKTPAGSTTTKEALKATYAALLQNLRSNFHGLNIEFRSSDGNNGWDFHDRFIIFPYLENGARAWSLGTSVNGLGKAHHILQEADNGQLIHDAFLELWDAVDQPTNLVWKQP